MPIMLLALTLRLPVAARPGLWVDEVFSLAIATGHSVEHSPAVANPSFGDFLVPPAPQPASHFAAYSEHGPDVTPLDRVVRAVALSDTNPPLYYLALSLWTRIAGTGDTGLRLFSTFCAIGCLPLIWMLASRVGTRATAIMSTVLFAVSPLAIYYSAEGRMYALTWLFGLGLANLTLRLRSGSPGLSAAWVIVAACGLLTHYFFAFVWLACALWAGGDADSRRRWRPAGMVAASAVIVLPWFITVPAHLSQWRITAGWLDGSPSAADRLVASAKIIHGLLFWGGAPISFGATTLLSVVIAVLVVRHARVHATREVRLLWMWAAASLIGLLAFDVWRGTRALEYLRYALPALPAVLILLALVLTTAGKSARLVIGMAIAGVWWHGAAVSLFTPASRPSQPFPEVAHRLSGWLDAGTVPSLVIVHSIPTGVIGLARYMKPSTAIYPSIARVSNTPTRAEIDQLTAAYSRFAYVRFHDLGTASTFDQWLAEVTRPDGGDQLGRVRIAYFTRRPAAGGR